MKRFFALVSVIILCMVGTVQPVHASQGDIKDDLWTRLNYERIYRNRPVAVLATQEPLASYAQNWATAMGIYNNFTHSNIGSLLGTWNIVGEVIGHGGPGTTARDMHVAWMNSSEHRNIMLDGALIRVSVGVYCAPNGDMWTDMVLARPTSSGPRPPGTGGNTNLNPILMTGENNITC